MRYIYRLQLPWFSTNSFIDGFVKKACWLVAGFNLKSYNCPSWLANPAVGVCELIGVASAIYLMSWIAVLVLSVERDVFAIFEFRGDCKGDEKAELRHRIRLAVDSGQVPPFDFLFPSYSSWRFPKLGSLWHAAILLPPPLFCCYRRLTDFALSSLLFPSFVLLPVLVDFLANAFILFSVACLSSVTYLYDLYSFASWLSLLGRRGYTWDRCSFQDLGEKKVEFKIEWCRILKERVMIEGFVALALIFCPFWDSKGWAEREVGISFSFFLGRNHKEDLVVCS